MLRKQEEPRPAGSRAILSIVFNGLHSGRPAPPAAAAGRGLIDSNILIDYLVNSLFVFATPGEEAVSLSS